jgi:hypothetical protein
MLRSLKDADETIVMNGVTIHLFQVPQACLVGLIFGCRMTDEKKSEIRSKLSSSSLSHVKVYEAVLDEKQFKLNIHVG